MKRDYVAEVLARAKDELVPIEKLKFDLSNVRFAHMQMERPAQKKMEDVIRKDTDMAILYQQIFAAGGILEALVVDSEYVVLEGNRRLACLKRVNREIDEGLHPESLKSKFARVPCKVLPRNTEQREKDIFVAVVHVAGKQPWKLFNRAGHIYRLNTMYKMSYDEIARAIGVGKASIVRNVAVYQRVLEYHDLYPNDGEWFRTSTYFDELYKRKTLKDIRDDEQFIRKFMGWIKNNKFRDVRDVRELKKVLDDPSLRQTFERHGFEAVVKEMESTDPSIVDPDFKKIKQTIELIRSAPRSSVEGILANPAKYKMIIELQAEIQKLLVDLDIKKRTLQKPKGVAAKGV